MGQRLLRYPTSESRLLFVLYFCPIKKANLKTLLEKSTELGVQHLIPVMSQNANTVIDTNLSEQLQRCKIESVEQSERFSIPILHNTVKLTDLCKSHPQSSTSLLNQKLLVCRERQSEESPPRKPIMKAMSEVLISTAGELSSVREPVAGILIGKLCHHSSHFS
jgi:RsmE family RNA methyltransferase